MMAPDPCGLWPCTCAGSVLHARLGCGPCPALEVANPLSVAVSATVGVTGGCYVAFDGMVLAAAGEPRAAASRLAYLLGLIRA